MEKLTNKSTFKICTSGLGGIIRLYFGYKQNTKNTIVILTGEFQND